MAVLVKNHDLRLREYYPLPLGEFDLDVWVVLALDHEHRDQQRAQRLPQLLGQPVEVIRCTSDSRGVGQLVPELGEKPS